MVLTCTITGLVSGKASIGRVASANNPDTAITAVSSSTTVRCSMLKPMIWLSMVCWLVRGSWCVGAALDGTLRRAPHAATGLAVHSAAPSFSFSNSL